MSECSAQPKRLVAVLLFAISASGAAVADPPPGYYDTVDLTSQATLRATLHAVIDGHTRIPYTSSSTDTWDVLELADEDPYDTGRILDLYRNRVYPKQGGGNVYYNREHSWPNSYGFPDEGSTNLPYSDCHHLFLCDIGYNNDRGSLVFGDCVSGCNARPTDEYDGQSGVNYFRSGTPVGVWETWSGRRGDVARAILYMDVRYEGDGTEPDLIATDDLDLIVSCQTGDNEPIGYMGLVSVLLLWHEEDPVDQRELARNDVVYQFQHNRNPFIDHPEWVDLLYGDGLSDVPDLAPALAITSVHPNPFNPATQIAFTLPRSGPVHLAVFGLDGRFVASLVSGYREAGPYRATWNGRGMRGESMPGGVYLLRLDSGALVDSEKLLLLK
ncbi:MAG TPA: endonuclease [Candidatus Krumholzibacteria bacterium]|nr:endonuclease [Candidatus Krumholzibacteria bacterium]HPD70414.1 endonuclease [Candidatus Krumholzibacteria bacterium]HRY39886.1 endonuclease [Candidatus Krumholzibacteria bacterium]